jgi:glutamate transport system permease protein
MSADAVLYDHPGPRAKVRNTILTMVFGVAILALLYWIYRKFDDKGQWAATLWKPFTRSSTWLDYILPGLGHTLAAAAVAMILSLVFGLVFSIGRLSEHWWLRIPAGVVVEFFRAVPLLLLMFFIFFGVPFLTQQPMSPFWAVVIALTLYNGSVLAEVFRAGIQSLPKGQSEAAYALGMRKTQVMFLVLLPQAIRAMLPTIISQLVVLLKDTALGFIITYQELLYYARYIGSQGTFGRPIVPSTIVATAIYVVMCLLLTALATYLERRNRRNKKVVAAPPAATENLVAASA